MQKLSKIKAYKAMFSFLDAYYFRMSEPDDIGGLLGGLNIVNENPVKTLDLAMWEDWIEAVGVVQKGKQQNLTTEKAYEAMQQFLNTYFQRGKRKSHEIGVLLGGCKMHPKTKKTLDPAMWQYWLKAIEAVQKEEEDSSETSKVDE
jgi:hypothetical protein